MIMLHNIWHLKSIKSLQDMASVINYSYVSYGARHKINAVMWMKSLMSGHSNQTSLTMHTLYRHLLLFIVFECVMRQYLVFLMNFK